MDKPTLAWRDAAAEVWLDLGSQGARSVLTALGTLIGVAVLVSTLGLATSASARIATRFDALAATEFEIRPAAAPGSDELDHDPTIPFDAPTRLQRIDGVESSATFSHVKGVTRVSGAPINDPSAALAVPPVLASSPDLLRTVRAEVRGRGFDAFHNDRAEPVALLGADAARSLHVSDVDRQPTIFIDDQPVAVLGIITATERKPELLGAVIVTDGFARRALGMAQPERVLVTTRIGAAEVVGAQVGYAVRPDDPTALVADVPPSPTLTRDAVAGDTATLLLVLASISLVIGGLGIANVTLVSVLERVPEIGLRRALGARRMHVVVQFLLESTALGFVGAVAGTAVGIIVIVTVSWTRDWPPTMAPWLPFAAPVVGAAIGLLAGVYPSLRAGRVEPIEALRAR